MTTQFLVRRATAGDAAALARLRWRWDRPDEAPRNGELDEFASVIEEWFIRRGQGLVCMTAAVGDDLVGMASLAVVDRMPNPGDAERRHGDVQSVFVVPEFRGHGIGIRLVEALVDAASELGVRKLTVDSTTTAVPFYRQVGFALAGTLLQRDLTRAAAGTRDAPAGR